MEPHFVADDLPMFYDYLNHSTNYFEFGAGGSTVAAVKSPTMKKVGSVESDPMWYASVSTEIDKIKRPDQMIDVNFVDLKATLRNWGYPGNQSNVQDWKKYSTAYQSEFAADLILIDGRFRVACALDLWFKVDDHCVILVDDFMDRPHYHILLMFYDVIKVGTLMVVLKRKPNALPPSEAMIKMYQEKPE